MPSPLLYRAKPRTQAEVPACKSTTRILLRVVKKIIVSIEVLQHVLATSSMNMMYIMYVCPSSTSSMYTMSSYYIYIYYT